MDSTALTHKYPTWLAFDASVIGASVALSHGGKVYSVVDEEPNRQAARLVPMIEQVLNEAGIWYQQVQRLITTVGPGSFTGIRIGLATAQGIVAAQAMEVSVLTTLEAIAWKAKDICGNGEVWVAINAGKGEVYSQLFHVKHSEALAQSGIALVSPEVFSGGVKADQTIVGNVEAMLPEMLRGQYTRGASLPDARAFVSASVPLADANALVPMYIRAPDAKLPVKG